jgi:hypothetical protein
MEVTLENIFDLFKESERQRANYLAERESERESERVAREATLESERVAREAERVARDAARIEDARLFDEKLKKQRIENDKYLKKMNKDLNKRMGGLSDIFGLYAQSQTKERIIKMFGKRGIELRTITTNYVEEDGKGGFLYEIDILLYNTLYAIVVEVKNQLKKDDIDEHIERLEKCVLYPPRGTEGKILLAASAAMIVSQEVENYATKKGFFIIKPSGKSVKLANKENFKPTEWVTKVN